LKVVVVGSGYVGLPAAIMLARSGHEVVCFDVDEARVAEIQSGILRHITEPELAALLSDPAVKTRLRAQSHAEPADAFIIAVPTPLQPRKKVADLSAVVAALHSIGPHLQSGNLVILESTVPPLTTREVVIPILASYVDDVGEIDIAHCPERVLPGDVVREIVENDRVVGGVTRKSADRAAALYATFVKGRIVTTDVVTAELCKLMENTYRDVNIALATELSNVADGLGVNVREATALANMHPRVHLLTAGIGVGGHCVPIDPWFIKEVDPANSQLIFTSRAINEARPAQIARKVRGAISGIDRPRIVLLGMTYKPNTYDVRESPALEVARLLREDGYAIEQYDPFVPGCEYGSLREAAQGKDCLAILVPHDAVMAELQKERDAIVGGMRTPCVVTF
jgi:UDP-N-acetyl-D-mannosaminuronic acid dehydrogenase